jgi:ribosomal protein S18 acetylase RimI-like enzyme
VKRGTLVAKRSEESKRVNPTLLTKLPSIGRNSIGKAGALIGRKGMSRVRVRAAEADDLSAVVDLLADDEVIGFRENAVRPIAEGYLLAFQAITEDPNNELLVADRNGEVVGTLQLTFIPNITCMGGWRAHIEGLMVSSNLRGQGIGTKLMEHAIARARQRGCCLVQLTTNKKRIDAHHFYEKLGFSFTHEGAKLMLESDSQNTKGEVNVPFAKNGMKDE